LATLLSFSSKNSEYRFVSPLIFGKMAINGVPQQNATQTLSFESLPAAWPT
jgi:hypothetical protein